MPELILSPTQAAELFLNAIYALLAGGFGSAPITLLIVSLLKRIPGNTIGGGTLQVAVALLLTAVFWIAQRFGYDAQFQSIVDWLLTLGPATLTLLGGLGVSTWMYNAAKASGVPVVGYQRNPLAKFSQADFPALQECSISISGLTPEEIEKIQRGAATFKINDGDLEIHY